VSSDGMRASRMADLGSMDAPVLDVALDSGSKPDANAGSTRTTEVAAPAGADAAMPSMDAAAPAQRSPSNAKMSGDSMKQMEPPPAMFWDHWLWPVPDATPGAKHAPNYTATVNTVVDNVTKLTWQRSRPAIYEGCTASLDGGPQGSACTQDEARAYCKSSATAISLGGTGWRLPRMSELTTLWDPTRLELGADELGIDLFAFPNASSADYWTDNSPAGPESGAVANFTATVLWLSSTSRTQGANVRCVRSVDDEVTETAPHFRVSSGTVTALHTGLTWQQHASTGPYDWKGAISYCQTLNLDGTGWRLPAIKELLSLAEDRFKSFDPEYFPDEGKYACWSSTELRSEPSTPVAEPWVWYVHFNGGTAGTDTVAGQNWVRCVR
jgi:hypothetical protein